MSASLSASQEQAVSAPTESESADADETSAAAGAAGGEVDDLIAKAAAAVEAHGAAAQLSRFRMARLSADAASTLRSAIAHETPTVPGKPSRGVTSGTRLDVQR